MSDDEDLEQLVREGLHRRADDVQVPPRLVAEVVGARPRRRRRLVAVVAAAAAVAVILVGLQAVHSSSPDLSHSDPGRSAPGHSDSGASEVASWRHESWHGLRIAVPGDWGWGTAPIQQDGQAYLCGGPGAVVLADGRKRMNPARNTPYVGRPVMLSDSCQGGDVITGTPNAPYAWLGADIPVGSVDLGGGYVQQTVQTHGTTLTVAADDASLRRRILGSVTASDCPDDVVGQLPQAYEVGGPGGRIQGAGLCVFQRSRSGSRAGTLQLAYGGELSAEQARAYDRAARQAPAPDSSSVVLGPGEECSTDELAVIRLTIVKGSATWVRNTVVNLDCGWVTTHRGDYRTLDDATRAAVVDIGGLRAVLASENGSVG